MRVPMPVHDASGVFNDAPSYRLMSRIQSQSGSHSDELRILNAATTKPRKQRVQPLTFLPETGLLRIETVISILGIGRSSLWKGVKEGKYPQPVKLGPKTTRWRAEDIRAYLNSLRGGE
jgi:prophage regulatory protein